MNVDINTEIAKRFGINAAIVVNHLWNEHNKLLDDGKNNIHSKVWVRCSHKKLSVVFPFITANKARRAIECLISAGIIVIGEFNPSRFDRTSCYAFTEHGYDLMEMDYERQEKHKKHSSKEER